MSGYYESKIQGFKKVGYGLGRKKQMKPTDSIKYVVNVFWREEMQEKCKF